MFIVCPKCFFKRTVDSKQIPAAATMATCPRCENKFRFRDPETGAFIKDTCLEFEETTIVPHNTDQEHEPIADEIMGDALTQNADISPNTSEDNPEDISEDTSKNSTHKQSQTVDLPKPSQGMQESKNVHKVTDMQEARTQAEKTDYSQSTENSEILNKSQTKPFQADSNASQKIQDTSDEKPLLEDEVARPKEQDSANPLLDSNQQNNDLEKNKKSKKSERYQMVSDDVPWEHPERYGIFGSLFQTIARVMFRAPEFFSTIHSQSSALRPALFYALLGLFQTLCLQMWISTLEQQILEVAPVLQESFAAMNTPLAIILSPFQAVFQLVLYSAFLYLAVRITDPNKADFNLILRVVAYAYAPTVLSIVPSIGPMIGLVWFVFNIVVGLRYALRLTWQKTFLALAPIFVLLAFLTVSMMSAFQM